MISDEELLDASNDIILVKNTQQDESPRTFSCHLFNCIGISSKGAIETINNTQSMTDHELAT